jgi:hypothetical protein
LHSLESSYKLINEYDVDGYKIDQQEYEILNLSYEYCLASEQLKEEKIIEESYEDIDGEPI